MNMKKIIGILLLMSIMFILPLSYTGIYIYKKKIKREIKWRMIAGLERSELVELKFANAQLDSELRWEHSKEFEYCGQMYDVASKIVIGDTTTFYCWWDHEETALNKKLKSLVQLAMGQRQPDQNTNQQTQLRLFMSTLFYSSPLEWKVFTQLPTNSKIELAFFELSDVKTTEPTPPPEVV